MKKNKAFTLIELIAVLVILAIISLIVAPLILNIIRRVKDVANKRSVDGYGRAVEYAMASYQLEHLAYPDSFDKLEIEYKGNKVECKTNRINPDYSIYLSECKVNGRLVKDDKEVDGYYHYGTLKMTNIEYVDTYGKNLEDALKEYYDEHNEYPSDYTMLAMEELDKEVSCDVKINCDSTIYLSSCSVDNEEVVDYAYGKDKSTAVKCLLDKTNSKSITKYTDGDVHEMYTFEHDETVQTPALIDYRYIGSDPYNYVKFNGNETWRIIGVFSVDDGNGNYEESVKLIRNESLGNKQWDENNVNEWVGSTMQVYLNDTYILDDVSINMIDSVKWYLGGRSTSSVNGSVFYTSERSETVKNGDRSKNWIGTVALMYPSDYIYTYALGVDDTCYNSPNSCNNSTPLSGWLYKSTSHHWTMMPHSSDFNNVFIFISTGYINLNFGAKNSFATRPVLYLKPNVKIKSGDGSIDSPYEFEL